MRNIRDAISILVILGICMGFMSAVEAKGVSHLVSGNCWDAADGTPADGSTVTAYIQTRPDEKLDTTVGTWDGQPEPNAWAINAGNFPTAWQVKDRLIVEVDNGAGCTANTSVTLTGAGADIAPDMTLSSSGSNATNPPANDSQVSGERHSAGGSNSGVVPPPIPSELSNISGVNESKIGVKIGANDTSINASETATANVSAGTEGSEKKNESPAKEQAEAGSEGTPSKGSESPLWMWGIILLLTIAAIIGAFMVIRKREGYK